MNIHKNPGISHTLFVIPALVLRHSQVHPKISPALRHAPEHIPINPIVLLYQSSEIPVIPVPVIRDPSYSEGRLECPPRVWYSPEIDTSNFTLYILTDTPGGFQILKYILLVKQWIEPSLSLMVQMRGGDSFPHIQSALYLLSLLTFTILWIVICTCISNLTALGPWK